MSIPISFDARMAEHSGIGTYIRNLLLHLTLSEELNLTLYGNLEKIMDFQARKIKADYPIYSLKEQIFFPCLLRKEFTQILHVPHYNAPLGYKGNLIVTVHDLIHLLYPPSRTAYLYARTMLEAVSRKAKIIITVSNHTKEDLIRLLGVPEKKIRVIYSGAGNKKIARSAEKTVAEKPYLLYVGNIKPHKNVRGLIHAYQLLKKQIPEIELYLVGKNSGGSYLKEYNDIPGIRWINQVSQTRLAQIYSQARAFILPSFYEGFGFPPLEAMAHGVPVLCSNRASLPEVVGDAALLFEPDDPKKLAENILEICGDEKKREALIQKGFRNLERFSWERCARETIQAYRECL